MTFRRRLICLISVFCFLLGGHVSAKEMGGHHGGDKFHGRDKFHGSDKYHGGNGGHGNHGNITQEMNFPPAVIYGRAPSERETKIEIPNEHDRSDLPKRWPHSYDARPDRDEYPRDEYLRDLRDLRDAKSPPELPSLPPDGPVLRNASPYPPCAFCYRGLDPSENPAQDLPTYEEMNPNTDPVPPWYPVPMAD
jgi:hypothetical protein